MEFSHDSHFWETTRHSVVAKLFSKVHFLTLKRSTYDGEENLLHPENSNHTPQSTCFHEEAMESSFNLPSLVDFEGTTLTKNREEQSPNPLRMSSVGELIGIPITCKRAGRPSD